MARRRICQTANYPTGQPSTVLFLSAFLNCIEFPVSWILRAPKLRNVRSGRGRCDRAFLDFPTKPFTILEPRDQEIGEFYVVQKRRATGFEAPKLWKGSSGWAHDYLRTLVMMQRSSNSSNWLEKNPFMPLEEEGIRTRFPHWGETRRASGDWHTIRHARETRAWFISYLSSSQPARQNHVRKEERNN